LVLIDIGGVEIHSANHSGVDFILLMICRAAFVINAKLLELED